MAVRYELAWIDPGNKEFKTSGVQVFQFNNDGLIEMNCSGYNVLEGGASQG